GADDAPHAASDDSLVSLVPDLARSELALQCRVELPPSGEHVHDAASNGLKCTAAMVAGLAIDPDWSGLGLCRNLVRGESLSNWPADVRQTTKLCDADPLGPVGLTLAAERRLHVQNPSARSRFDRAEHPSLPFGTAVSFGAGQENV